MEAIRIVLTEKDKRASKRKASRESYLGEPRFKHKVHKNKKAYDRKKDKKVRYNEY